MRLLTDNPIYSAVVAAVGAAALYLVALRASAAPASLNPFARDSRRADEGVERRPVVRAEALRARFSAERAAGAWDAIVVGSGVGGLVAGAILSRAGKRVLVLEQHDQAGGCLHEFEEGPRDARVEFSTGIHYIGEMRSRSAVRYLFDQLTSGQLHWVPLADAYDVVSMNGRRVPIRSGREGFAAGLREAFPGAADGAAIDAYMASLAAVRAGTAGFVALKLLPRWVGRALAATGLVDWFTPFFKFARVTLDEHLRSLTGNAELRAVLSYSWGDYGTPPASASFATHALLTNHMLLGVAFPRGGSSEVARLLAATIREGGGDVLVRARVERLLFDGAGRAAGVRVAPARGAAVDLAARAVVSDAGVFNTFERLCGDAPAPGVRAAAARYLSHVRHGVGGLQLFVALRGTAEELALNTASLWAFEVDGGFDLSAAAGAFLARSPDALNEPVPLLFISFPSTKCPDWEARYPGRSTCEVVTLANWEWFADGGPPGARSATYAARKEALKSAILAQLLKHFPQLQGRVLHATLGTPATNSFYLGAARGEMYGADHNKERFAPEAAVELRPDTGVPGLFLSGQDVFNCGFAGAAFGGVLAASAALGRNVYEDLLRLRGVAGQVV